MQLPALPSFNTTIPQQIAAMPSPLEQYGKMLQLRALSGQIQQQQQLQPLQVQQAQEAVKQAQLDTQLKQTQAASLQARVKAWSDPDFVNSFMGGSNPGVEKQLGFAPGFDPIKMIKGEVSRGVNPDDAMKEASSFLSLSKNLSEKTKDDLSNYKAAHEQVANILAPVLEMKAGDPATAAAFDAAKQKAATIPGLDPQDAQFVLQSTLDHAPALIQRLGIAGDLADHHLKTLDVGAKSADLWKKELENAQTADPLLKMQMNPMEAFSGDKLPASMAYLAAKVKDPDPKVATLATQLLGVANTSKKVELSIDRAKKEAAQSIQDGDPNAAAKLLVDGTVAPSQIISARKPEFAQKAFSAAAQLQPGWNAQKADADFKVAASPGQVAFFGSAKSLTDKGGTLDQLAAAGKDIPENQIPVFNTVADAIKASTGSGPIAKYAAIALGVADDYAKVMGGGQGSDTSRTQALNIISAKQSPEQRSASIEGIRGAVGSQTKSRIGGNAVLQKMYGESETQTKTNDFFSQFGGKQR